MAVDVEGQLLERYREELLFLRRMGAKFAKQYPRLARRLELDGSQSPDPHVERLLEGVAFLTARLQQALDGELPQVTAGLLGYLYPHFTQPVPSMAIAQLQPDDGGAGLTSGLEVPRHSKLFIETSFQRRTCRFRTCYPVTLWPIEVTKARAQSPNAFPFLGGRTFSHVQSCLQVTLKTNSEPLSLLAPDRLRFYLDGEPAQTGTLYELLTTNLVGVVALPDGKVPALGATPHLGRVRPLGFDEEEEVLPTQGHALRGYSLLQEYFALPEKFMFVEAYDLDFSQANDTVDLLFLFDTAPRRRLSVGPGNLRLGCTPIINLFEKLSEPVHIDHQKLSYRVQPDARWERTTEIHSIEAVTTNLRRDDPASRLAPLYGLGHSNDEGVVYWDARRAPCQAADMPGTDVFLSFVDADLRQRVPDSQIVRAHCLCTNRDLATHIDQGERLHIEDGPHALVRTLTRPTLQRTPPLQGATLWRLVSHLSLSHLGLPDGESATEALREQLRIYAFTSAESIEPQLQAIDNVRRETVALRADDEAWRGFVRVQRITLRLDEDRFGGRSPMVLGAVLNAYFALHASVNVFTQLALESRQREGMWKVWPPMIPKTTLP